MRRISEEDKATMTMLEAGAQAAAGKVNTDQKLAQLSDQIKMLQYSLSRVLQTLASYPMVKSQLDQLDYRTLGISRAIADMQLQAPNGPTSKLGEAFDELVEKHAKAAKVDAFTELSDADDKDRGLTVADDEALTENHWVILTSECSEDSDQGIFRSKMDVGGEEFATLKEDFLGKKVGDTFVVKIQGKDHSVTVLGVRKKPDASTEK